MTASSTSTSSTSSTSTSTMTNGNKHKERSRRPEYERARSTTPIVDPHRANGHMNGNGGCYSAEATNDDSNNNMNESSLETEVDGYSSYRIVTFYRNHCRFLPAMLGWFVFSSLLSVYNKVIFGKNNQAFPCPLLITSVHFFVQWFASYILSTTWPNVYGGNTIDSMSWKKFLSASVPCGFITALDVGLSNLSLVLVTITFYTMVKASSPIFVVLSAFFMGLEQISASLILVVLVISAGEFLTVIGEVEFDAVGFALCLGASISSGIRWTMVQLKIQKLDPQLKTPVETMRLLSPTMFLFMLGIALIKERPWVTLAGTDYIASPDKVVETLCMALAGAAFAICMLLCELYLIMKSSAIVLMIGGVLKEMVTIMLGVVIFNDSLNPINLCGIGVVFLGVILYKIIFHMRKLEQDNNNNTNDDNLNNNDENDDDDEDNGELGKGRSRRPRNVKGQRRKMRRRSSDKVEMTAKYRTINTGISAEEEEEVSSLALSPTEFCAPLVSEEEDDDEEEVLVANSSEKKKKKNRRGKRDVEHGDAYAGVAAEGVGYEENEKDDLPDLT